MPGLARLSIAIGLAATLLLLSACQTHAAEVAVAEQTTSMNPVVFFFAVLIICIAIGIVAVLGGTGGGVMFTPLAMGFTSIDSYIVRATGILVAMAGSLVTARPFLRRGLANMRMLFFAGVPYTIFAVIGALMAEYVKATMGQSGEALIRLALGGLVVTVALLVLFGGRRVEYPKVDKVDRFTERLDLSMGYWEASLGKVVRYKVKRAHIAIVLFCGTGLISGMFGLGAGWAMVPVFNLVMIAPLKVAAASSKVLIGLGDTAAVWPYMMGGGIFPLFAVPSIIGIVIGGIIGARIMLRIKAGFIRWLVIAVMLGSGVKLILDGIARLG